MKVIYIIGKFRGPTAWDVAENVREAEREALEVARMGAMPMCPHANTAHFHGQCDDQFWLDGTLELALRCDAALTVAGDEWRSSAGSVGEVSAMYKACKPVFHGREHLRRWLEAGREADRRRPSVFGPCYATREQRMVREFNVALGCERGSTPAVRAGELRARLVEEEAAELARALRAGDLVEVVDGCCDLQYVTLGAADACGVPLGAFFDEVHRTNMLKVGGPRREDGKVCKPEGWEPPKIAMMLASLMAPGE